MASKQKKPKTCYVVVYTMGMRPAALKKPQLVPFKSPTSAAEKKRVSAVLTKINQRSPFGIGRYFNVCGDRQKILAEAVKKMKAANVDIRAKRAKDAEVRKARIKRERAKNRANRKKYGPYYVPPRGY